MVIEGSLLRWIPAAPLMTALACGVVLAVVQRPLPRALILLGCCGSVLASLVLSSIAFGSLVVASAGVPEGGAPVLLVDTLYTWVGAGVGASAFSADLAFRYDALSAVMCFVVTGVGFLIHVYSVGYMAADRREDGGLARFFCYLNLFTAAMLVLVLADNLLLMFLGWEGVGLCSYLLIGFWYSDSENAYAGSKAFIVNRVGDFGLLLGILLIFWATAEAGSPAVSFRAIEAGFGAIAEKTLVLPSWLGGEWGLANVIGLCFFFGAAGKSAQLPLYVWLPDAMAGPTPVSALIHAATMVTAGVYLVVRMSFLYAVAPTASEVIAWTGGVTALFAALMACSQTDIKKVLAYSTVSQLGYMFLAVGAGAYGLAVFHLVTHAFFKALLFMAAGAVILAIHHEQDLWAMGGLRSRMKRTWWVMLIGALTLAGVPPLSGFFSKDEILTTVYLAQDLPGHRELYGIGVATAGLTAFYIARLVILAFHGKTRLPRGRRAEVHDPGELMMWPLYLLATMAVLGGLLGVPQFFGDRIGVAESDSLGNFLASVVVSPEPHVPAPGLVWQLIGVAFSATLTGVGLAYGLYVVRPQWVGKLAGLQRWLGRDRIDQLYTLVVVRPLVRLSELLSKRVDAGLIDTGLVGGTAGLVRGLATHGLRYVQSGLVQGYLLLMVAGALAVLVYLAGF